MVKQLSGGSSHSFLLFFDVNVLFMQVRILLGSTFALIAQLVEQAAVNRWVTGSSPVQSAIC